MSDDQFQVLCTKLDRLLEHLGAAGLARGTAPETTVDLDGKYGDPIIRAKDPRDWSGDPQTGKPMSECPPSYLDLVADRLDYFAEKENDEKKKRYNQLDAARARGWAKRLRAGWTRQPEPPHKGFGDAKADDDIPF